MTAWDMDMDMVDMGDMGMDMGDMGMDMVQHSTTACACICDSWRYHAIKTVAAVIAR